MESIGLGPCSDITAWTHIIVASFSTVTTAVTGYVAVRVRDARLDRRLKYRQMELQLQAAERRIVEVTTERKRVDD